MRYTLASLAALAASVSAQGNMTQSLLSSLKDRTDVQAFKGLLGENPSFIDDIFADAANATSDLKGDGVTLLIPNDEAVGAFVAANPSASPSELGTALRPILSYHVMAAPLRSANFSEPRGLTIPTLLDGNDEQGTSFNLREAAPEIQQQFGQGATGQVLFAKLEGLDAVRLRTRQDGDQSAQTALRGGLAQSAMMDVVDGEWAGGVYQIVNAVLEPPRPCSKTIRSLKDTLGSLDAALNKTDLWPALDKHPNVTCLAPSTDAFKAAGNPEVELDQDALTNALLDHTLEGPSYSNYLRDGMKFGTLSNKTVQVTLNDSGIWFNDAKVIQMNVLTNNGLVHVLDKVMTVTEDSDSDGDGDGGSDDATQTDSANGAEETGDGENAAGVSGVNGALMGAAAAVVYVLV